MKVTSNLRNKLDASSAPSATDDSTFGYGVGSIWVDTTANEGYVCLDSTATSAIWSNISGAALTDGCGTTVNGSSIDLGGTLDNGTAANNIYFLPSTGANIIRWGADSLGNLPTGSGGAAHYISRFDYVAFSGEHKIYGASGSSGVAIGVYESQVSNVYLKQYKDVAQISMGSTPGTNSDMTFQEQDSPTYWQRDIWESHGSNTKSYAWQSFDKQEWKVDGTNGHSAFVSLNRSIFSASIPNSAGTAQGLFFVRENGVHLMDSSNVGLTTFPDIVLVGKLTGTSLYLDSSGVTESKYVEGATVKKGIRYTGFGESDIDTGAGASYAQLVNTSLVPKKYVDDAIAASGSTPALNNGEIYVGDASNAAQSVAMSGDVAISNTGATTIQPDSVTYDKMQDTTQAALLGNQSGAGTIAEIPIVEAYLTTGTVTALLENTSNWDVNGNYTGTAITGTYQGQAHYDGNYWFTAVDDNDWIRLIRG